MRILWLKADLLLPLDTGGKLRTWHLMRHLAKRHEITFLSFADPARPREDIEGMHEVARRVEVIPRRPRAKGSARFFAEAGLRLVDPVPYAVSAYRSTAYRSRLTAMLAQDRFDVIVCDFLPPAINLPVDVSCPAVIFTHNVEAEIWRRHAECATGWLKRRLYRTQYRRMLRFEGRTLARFDRVLAVSDDDRDTFARLYPGACRRPASVIPTGVDTEFFAPGDEPALASNNLVFTGSMDWLPNEDAMVLFCQDILPRIRAAIPGATLSIVGRAPTAIVQKLGRLSGVTVTGRVDDVRPYMREAAVYVVPLRIGGGTRLKIFEAMAMGQAVVSTTVGAEGLGVVNGEHLLLADAPYTFANAVIGLLRDSARRAALGRAARALVAERYDWSAAAAVMEQALLSAAGEVEDTPPQTHHAASAVQVGTWDEASALGDS